MNANRASASIAASSALPPAIAGHRGPAACTSPPIVAAQSIATSARRSSRERRGLVKRTNPKVLEEQYAGAGAIVPASVTDDPSRIVHQARASDDAASAAARAAASTSAASTEVTLDTLALVNAKSEVVDGGMINPAGFLIHEAIYFNIGICCY